MSKLSDLLEGTYPVLEPVSYESEGRIRLIREDEEGVERECQLDLHPIGALLKIGEHPEGEDRGGYVVWAVLPKERHYFFQGEWIRD